MTGGVNGALAEVQGAEAEDAGEVAAIGEEEAGLEGVATGNPGIEGGALEGFAGDEAVGGWLPSLAFTLAGVACHDTRRAHRQSGRTTPAL